MRKEWKELVKVTRAVRAALAWYEEINIEVVMIALQAMGIPIRRLYTPDGGKMWVVVQKDPVPVLWEKNGTYWVYNPERFAWEEIIPVEV